MTTAARPTLRGGALGDSVTENYLGPRAWLAQRDAAAYQLLNEAYPFSRALAAETRAQTRQAVALPDPTPVSWRDAIAPGRIGHRPNAPMVLCHSLVTPAAYERLRKDGRVGPDPTHAELTAPQEERRTAAYDWMRWQMSQRIARCGGRYPMWLWARIRRDDLIGVLRQTTTTAPGDVLLTLEVPREQLLLTDYEEWHVVLNGQPSPPLDCPGCGTWHCNNPDCLDGWFDRWSDDWDVHVLRAGADPSGPWWRWPHELQSELLASWQHVFQPPRRRSIQACVEYVAAPWVRSAVTLLPK